MPERDTNGIAEVMATKHLSLHKPKVSLGVCFLFFQLKDIQPVV